MSTRRAKQHKEDTFFDVLDRKNAKVNDEGGRFNRFLNEVQCSPHKFRKRAYDREKEIEKKKVQQTLEETLEFFRTLLKILG
ncbi:hypothetical protein [Limosilactobacillus mucosae]|uniref:hypothetical protein n=1 Tax=Limosilactobacillus mucosae TaxID=97478 RepID=UPI002A91943E|nr:hypothetical protein [Limosilactobacillus mucosae]MDY5412476.1 hypothetical protein [Limosilactobacillus mucosae]